MNPKIKNPLILTVVSTVFLVPVLILSHFLFKEAAVGAWVVIITTTVIYFIIMFLVFLYYGNVGRK